MTYETQAGSVKMDDGRWSHSFSQSFLSSLQHCPEQARASYFGEIESEHTDSTALGTACHAGAEYALIEKMAGLEPSAIDAVQVALHELDIIGDWKRTRLSRSFVYEHCETMTARWVADVLPYVTPQEVEHKFKRLLFSDKRRDVYLTGTMDCVDEDDVVIDWKFPSRMYEAWELQRQAIQPTVYAWARHAARTSDPMPSSLFRYVVLTHSGEVGWIDVHRDQGDVDWLKETCVQVATMIEKKLKPWPLNSGGWWCHPRWCQKWDQCRGAHVTPGWDKTP